MKIDTDKIKICIKKKLYVKQILNQELLHKFNT